MASCFSLAYTFPRCASLTEMEGGSEILEALSILSDSDYLTQILFDGHDGSRTCGLPAATSRQQIIPEPTWKGDYVVDNNWCNESTHNYRCQSPNMDMNYRTMVGMEQGQHPSGHGLDPRTASENGSPQSDIFQQHRCCTEPDPCQMKVHQLTIPSSYSLWTTDRERNCDSSSFNHAPEFPSPCPMDSFRTGEDCKGVGSNYPCHKTVGNEILPQIINSDQKEVINRSGDVTESVRVKHEVASASPDHDETDEDRVALFGTENCESCQGERPLSAKLECKLPSCLGTTRNIAYSMDECPKTHGEFKPDRRLRRREQNRQAARRCRQRKKAQSQELVKEYYQLLSANSEIQSKLKILETEKQRLNDIYNTHLSRGCSELLASSQ